MIQGLCPASVGAHGGLACAFLMGGVDGEPDLLLIEAIEDQTIRDPEKWSGKRR